MRLHTGQTPESLLCKRRISAAARKRNWIVFAVTAVLVIVVAGVAVDAPHKISKGFHSFTATQAPEDPEALQDRLTDLNSNGRLAQWELAVEKFGEHPLDGTGAGTFARVWAQEGSGEFKVINAHSLYLEMLEELTRAPDVLLGEAVPGDVVIAPALGRLLVRVDRGHVLLLAVRLRALVRELDGVVLIAGEASAEEHSPVELKSLIALQSRPWRHPEFRQARTRLGTKPNIVALVSCTN